jgi:uncharacterized repeat protein (TIGR01451 family)
MKMKTQRTEHTRAVRWLSRLLLFGVLFTLAIPASVIADGTDPAEVVSNTASISYRLGGVDQVPQSSNTVQFMVDRKVDLTMTPVTSTFDPVIPNDDVLLAVQLQNTGNGTQGYRFNIADLPGNTFHADEIRIYIDGGTLGTLDGGDTHYSTYQWDGASYTETWEASQNADDIDKDQFLNILVVAEIPGSAGDGTSASYYVTATTLDATTENETSADSGAWQEMTEQTVFVDGSGASDADLDGTFSVQVTYTVGAADISALKTQTVVTDNIAGSTPPYKAIPGATVRYTITVTNNGSTAANNVVITDTIPDFTAYAANTVTIGGTGYQDTDPEVTYAAGPPAVLSVDVGNVPGGGGTAIVTFNVTIQ